MCVSTYTLEEINMFTISWALRLVCIPCSAMYTTLCCAVVVWHVLQQLYCCCRAMSRKLSCFVFSVKQHVLKDYFKAYGFISEHHLLAMYPQLVYVCEWHMTCCLDCWLHHDQLVLTSGTSEHVCVCTVVYLSVCACVTVGCGIACVIFFSWLSEKCCICTHAIWLSVFHAC